MLVSAGSLLYFPGLFALPVPHRFERELIFTYNVLEMLENSTAAFPEKIAVKEGEKSLTYSQLYSRSRVFGTALAAYDIKNQPVGVFMEKGVDALCTFMGIVYAGGFYSMLNTELPDSRLETIASVLEPKIIVTVPELLERARRLFDGVRLVTVDELDNAQSDGVVLDKIRSRMTDTDPLYINFTSGSTGVPKGIAVAHRSVIDFIGCFTKLFSIDETDVIANQAPFDFDVSVKDIYSALMTGAELVIVPRELFSAPVQLLDCLCDNGVTTMIWAVSALCLITTFHGLDYRVPDRLKKVLFSGEVMPKKHLKRWRDKLPEVMFVNLYGPTEITCNCTYHILDPDNDYEKGIPIGRPFPNEDVFLLDENNVLITETGKAGMIVVRGTALALGYYRMKEQNERSFIQNPLNDRYPETVYLTGDRGYYGEDGELYFCGRTDNQIKYMGHRIELEEIEGAMSSIEGVDRCFCVFDEEKQRLKGYYVGSIEKDELHSTMRSTLPPFMVPGYIRRIDRIVLTKNGKTDRKGTIALLEGK